MGGKGPQVHQFVGLYSDPQCDAGTITVVVICVLQIEPTSEQVSQTLLQVSQKVYDWVGKMSGQRTCVAKRIQKLEPGQSNHILKATR